jgi:hypothetical protein
MGHVELSISGQPLLTSGPRLSHSFPSGSPTIMSDLLDPPNERNQRSPQAAKPWLLEVRDLISKPGSQGYQLRKFRNDMLIDACIDLGLEASLPKGRPRKCDLIKVLLAEVIFSPAFVDSILTSMAE